MTARSFTTTTLSCFGVLGLALTLTGCGGHLDMSVINKSITDGLASQMGVTDATVTCPTETRPLKAGDTFDCEAKPKEGGKLTLKVTQKDDQGNIGWELTKLDGFLSLPKVEDAIKQANNGLTAVDCGSGAKKIRAAKAGDTFECKATAADGSAHPFVVTVKDADGNIAFAPKDAGGQEQPAPAEGAETPPAEPEGH
jgi:hypothetical protein